MCLFMAHGSSRANSFHLIHLRGLLCCHMYRSCLFSAIVTHFLLDEAGNSGNVSILVNSHEFTTVVCVTHSNQVWSSLSKYLQELVMCTIWYQEAVLSCFGIWEFSGDYSMVGLIQDWTNTHASSAEVPLQDYTRKGAESAMLMTPLC